MLYYKCFHILSFSLVCPVGPWNWFLKECFFIIWILYPLTFSFSVNSLRFTVSFLLINSRSSFFTNSYQCKNRTTWTAVRAPFFLYWPVDDDFVSKKETCTYLKCNLLITVLMMNNDIFFLWIFFVLVEN